MSNNRSVYILQTVRWFCSLGTLCALLGLSVEVSAQTNGIVLVLKNGDRLTGTLLSESDAEVVISTSWAKALTVPLPEISKKELVVPATATVVPSGPVPSPPAVVSSPAADSSKAKIARRKSWKGKVDVGADLGFSEQSWQLYYARAKIVYAPQLEAGETKRWSDRFKNTFDYQATYGKNEGDLTANKMDGASKTDFDLGKRVFVYNLLGAGYDEIRKIDLQYEVGPGVGYHVVTRSNFTFNTEFGVNYLVQHLDQTPVDRTVERFSLRLAEDATWTISKKLSLDEKLEIFPSIEEVGQFRLRFEANLRYALWQNGAGQSLYLALTLLDIYETQPATGVEKNDLQIRSSIGLSF